MVNTWSTSLMGIWIRHPPWAPEGFAPGGISGALPPPKIDDLNLLSSVVKFYILILNAVFADL